MQAPRYELHANTSFARHHFRALICAAIAPNLGMAGLITPTKQVHRDEYDNLNVAGFYTRYSFRIRSS